MLFPDDAEKLEQDVRPLEDQVACYNEGVVALLPKGRRQELRARIGDELAAALAGAVDQRVSYLVDRAKAETLRLLGEYGAAADLMAKYV